MKKVELLSPAGNMECLQAAIKGGCDAVYLSGLNFGARKFAGNFSNEELVEAVKLSHLHGVKVYVTVNTMLYQKELEEVYKYLQFLYLNNVDAVIVQDIGIMKLIHDKIPELEIHASTQCHNHSEYGIELLKSLNIKRAVLDRELNLFEIKKLSTKIDTEVFIHGALCVCYSGCCLFSSMNGGRSGNRGECVQSCRLSYKLFREDKEIETSGNYLLSTKELCTIKEIPQMIESGVKSFKIEGRMKSPAYVGIVTSLYRKYIDKYYEDNKISVEEEDIKSLKKLYNRKFTKGYINNELDIMNIDSQNHQGVEIGRVIEVRKGKAIIKLTDTLNQYDGIRFKKSNIGLITNRLYNKKGLLISSSSDYAIVDVKKEPQINDIVLKTIDYRLEESIKSFEYPKIMINMKILAKLNQDLEVQIFCEGKKISLKKNIIEPAQKSPTSREKIINQLTRLASTVYELYQLDYEIDDNIFINIKELNELRRSLIEKLDTIRLNRNRNKESIKLNKEEPTNFSKEKTNLNVLVRNEEQLKLCLDQNIDNIYVTDYKLYKKYENENNIYYRTSRIYSNNLGAKKILATTIDDINNYKQKEIVGDYYLNIVNNLTTEFLKQNNLNRVCLSVENNLDFIKDMDLNNLNYEVIVYGTIELMVTKYCPFRTIFKSCSNCSKKYEGYSFQDNLGNKYPIIKEDCLTHIMDSKKINYIDKIKYLNLQGVNNFRIELLNEHPNEIVKIITAIKNELSS